MSVYEVRNLFGSENKLETAIERVRHFGKNGVIVAYSGGKDSVAVLEVVKRANIPYRAVYNLTTVDHPELVRFVKSQGNIEIQRPKKNMWDIIADNHAVPYRTSRFCCRILKEQTMPEGIVVTGVRSEESDSRKRRRMFEPCYKDNDKYYLNPIIDWTESDVWEFIKTEKLPYCKLYDQGYRRLGCIGCPMDTNREQVLDSYPQYKRGYIRALDKLIKRGYPKNNEAYKFKTGYDWYRHWLSNMAKHDKGQSVFDFVYLDDNSYPRTGS